MTDRYAVNFAAYLFCVRKTSDKIQDFAGLTVYADTRSVKNNRITNFIKHNYSCVDEFNKKIYNIIIYEKGVSGMHQ
ncbi:hypothetical protein D5281_19645 [bacterium 1xD42-62]|uniref:Uncharacterized protein n=1 Tax=Parablautia muri TaxID=2320879 RepID=A0A9X5BJ47_9FIRM|nr:hypothetical protein [Parablautia muri]